MAESSELKQSLRMKELGVSLVHIDDSIAEPSEGSHYESFSTESKYDSFQDSLNAGQDLNSLDKRAAAKEINASNFLSEQVNLNGKKILIDKKDLASQFCDSLEDIHSLVSSGDKFSLSEEIEDINIVEISHTCDDSLKNDVCSRNKNSNSNELCFDEDSLAILENEKAFDDSLEDSNGVSHLDSLMLSKSKALDVDSLNEKVSDENKVSKIYFDTSIQIIYENFKETSGDVGNLEDCNKASSSDSELNLYRDSLEDLSDLSNQQSSSSSSYKSVPTEPSMANSANDLNGNEPETKSTFKKASTTFLKPLTELTSMPLDTDIDSGPTVDKNCNSRVTQDKKETKLSLSPLDANVKESDDTILYNVSDYIDDSVNNYFVSMQVDKAKEKVAKLSLNPLDSNVNVSEDTILYNVSDYISCIDDSVISSSFVSAKSNVEPQSTTNSGASVYVSEDTILYDVSDYTRYIDDSVVSSSLVSGKISVESQSKANNGFVSMHAGKANVKKEKLSLSPLDANNTICIDDSVISSSFTSTHLCSNNNIESQSTAKNEDFVSMGADQADEKVVKLSLSPLDANNTICIDDSVISSSFVSAQNNVEPQSTDDNKDFVIMEVDKADEKKSKLSLSPLVANNTICIDDSIISLSIVSAKNNDEPQSTANNDFDSIKILNTNQKYTKKSNIDDTIWIDNSIIEYVDKQPYSVVDSPMDLNVVANNTFVIDPVISSKPSADADVNETICIDDSIVMPLEPNIKIEKSFMDDRHMKKNRRHAKNFEKDFQKLRISDTDTHNRGGISHHDSPSNAGNTMIDIVVQSPIHRCQNRVSESYKRRNSEKISCSSPETFNEKNVKVHIEVKSQGVSVISVSEEHCVSPKKVTNYIKETEKEFKEKDSNLEKFRLKSIDSYSHRSSLDKNQVKQNRYLEDLDVKFGRHDVSLFQALDLHDSSINVSKNETLQSRDSLMPLNLCVRERTFERPNKIPENESKENIPFVPFKRVDSKKPNTPKVQKTTSPRKNKGTPLKNACAKEQLNYCETKKSATKIPIRKLNNTPSIQKKQKLDSKPCNSDTPFKSPFIVLSCPQKEGSEKTSKNPHHFCMVRNSISRVPKSSQKITPKKFQNIQSPVAKYIGNPSVQIPLKATHRYDGNLFPTNAEPPLTTMKTPKKIVCPVTPTSAKSDKKL
ncbi:hypothetical protein JTE90_000201 [Oedothorax gibbosus]|uniref:Uncharacterized protein n=1 Tax=Oedothorax gibbosus TaxID=931172 RepID=A0AAV6VD31_9ARAC|nr:hypothetical protein JTE90_000201 [Oedothorax gibbosus]